MNISELPGYHIFSNSLSYVEELFKVTTEEELYAFVKRWLALWEHDPMLKFIVNCEFDAREALECISDCRTSFCGHSFCAGASIVVPSSLLVANMVSHHYQVPICTALHQLFCRDKNHSGCF